MFWEKGVLFFMEQLKDYLRQTQQKVDEYITKTDTSFLRPPELREGALSYFQRGGKRLRPAILLLCAGALGGEEGERRALPAACGVELFHTWTLIHDDIIDNDDKRRGADTVHIQCAKRFAALGYPPEACARYGRDLAILAGDSLHALSVSLFCGLSGPPEVTLAIIRMLQTVYLGRLLDGEAVDTRNGVLTPGEFSVGTREETLSVIRGKTGALFEFSAVCGGMIGAGGTDTDDPRIAALGRFALDCGIAFQLQDDILGILSDEKTLGKPIGSDIREGKKTVILQYAYEHANEEEKSAVRSALGNPRADAAQLERVRRIFLDRGGVDCAARLARESIGAALSGLQTLPDSRYRRILERLAGYMLARNY